MGILQPSDTGMETSTILAITIPIGILVILIIILILICLLCPAWFAACRRKKNDQDQVIFHNFF